MTIHDVARSAGVSRQTVSRALNDKGEIQGTTKQRVLDAARELGYRPSRFARGLVRQDTVTVGLVIPDLLNPFFTEVAAAALEAAGERGWHVVVHDTSDSPEKERTALRVVGSQVDAVIGYFSSPEDEIDRDTRGVPVVLVGREHRATRFGSIRIDGAEAIDRAVAHLVARGHRSIGMLDHQGRPEPSDRHGWFAAAAAARGLDASAVAGAPQSVEGGEAALPRLLAAYPDVTAVLTFNDVIAVGALRAARRLGRRVPEDLAVVGFDGLRLGDLVEPALSTVSLDIGRLGALAVEEVARLLAAPGDPVAGARLVVHGSLLLRDSA
ncbi:LacI family DNA-binding transcriptional regulator [Streptomyces fuscigenes]|uniref:LacI family DNA-binding transcriptional regulator n=1 Tax=Streptomyces fuscigenes TaxID=1528880 RepID=UPI0027E03EE3|nr:LacI family DNA-binding transcriptional regulator [Streptomyces fuscigenes]